MRWKLEHCSIKKRWNTVLTRTHETLFYQPQLKHCSIQNTWNTVLSKTAGTPFYQEELDLFFKSVLFYEFSRTHHTTQSEPIIIMISHIMINQLYHIVSITDNRPMKLSYHLEIWYLDSENYHIISNAIFRLLKFIISYRNW